MTKNTPASPASPCHPRTTADLRRRVLSAAQLKMRGVSVAEAAARCGDGGPWQRPLPGVYVLHPEPLTGEERLRAALLYAGRPPASGRRSVPAQPGPEADPESGYGEAMITGLAALALHGFAAAPPPAPADAVDVLVPRTRRLRSVGYVRLVRSAGTPRAEQLRGLPVAPVERALADAIAGLGDPWPYAGCSSRRCAADTANRPWWYVS